MSTLAKNKTYSIKDFYVVRNNYKTENISDLVDRCFDAVKANYGQFDVPNLKEIISVREPRMKTLSSRNEWYLTAVEHIDFRNDHDITLFKALSDRFRYEWKPARPGRAMYLVFSGLVLQSAYAMAAFQKMDLKRNLSDWMSSYKAEHKKEFYDVCSFVTRMDKKIEMVRQDKYNLFPDVDDAQLSQFYKDAKEKVAKLEEDFQLISDNLFDIKRHICPGQFKAFG
jgi:hypothetical protein